MKPNTVFSLATLVALSVLDGVQGALPNVDFDRMGKVGLFGNFAGLDWFNQTSSFSLDPTSSSLLSRSSDGSLSRIGSTNPGGTIYHGCPLKDVFYVAGQFSSFGGTQAQNIASYTPSSGKISALGSGGPNGVIRSVYCDVANNRVWVGGQFSTPSSLVAIWNPSSSSWSAPPFGGLPTTNNGEVLAISSNSSQSSLFFAGSFVTSFQSSSVNGTNNPNVPFSPGASPFSSSLVPVPLGTVEVDPAPSSSDPNFSDIRNILCPTGDDGPGQSWFAMDGTTAVITVRTFSSLSAAGLRLGNTFLDGRGTTAFTLTTIPDNTIQTLTYVDPSTGNNQTCTENCPLLTNPSILYQDFLFQQSVAITGFQLKLSQWRGTGPGLHLLQLLSSGAFASAVDSQNSKSCYAPVPSNSTFTGTWTPVQANTNIAATMQTVLVSQFPVGTSPANGPSFTWMPYVSASGQYEIDLLVPGCDEFQDCDLRTSVDVTVFPGGGQDPWVTTVSQRNGQDSVTNIYSGVVVPSSPSFVVTIAMTLSKSPEGSGSNGQYRIVADRVQLVLKSPDINGTSSNGSGFSGSKTGFGFLEWPLSVTSLPNNSSGTLPNTTQTSLDIAGFDLFNALGGYTNLLSSKAVVGSVVQHPSGTLFLAGQFSLSSGTASGASNIVAFAGGALHVLSNNGLNGNVTALLLVENRLYVGGHFTDTATGSTNGALSGVAIYDVSKDQWSALGGGVDGTVSGLSYTGGHIQVIGNFTRVRNAKGDTEGLQVPDIASWSDQSGGWTNGGGYLIGSLDVIVNGTNNKNAEDVQYVAGHVASALRYGANGFALLATGENGGFPGVTTLNTTLDPVGSTSSSPSRRSVATAQKRSFMPSVSLKHLFKRQSSTPTQTQTQSANSPVVYAGAFWTNSSSKQQIVILGGNFSLPAFGGASGLAAYNVDTGVLSPLPGSTVVGVVRALLVNGDILYVGGEFSIQGSNLNGFAIYDLAGGKWANDGLQPLVISTGTVSVKSLRLSQARSDTLVVAGSFDSAGSFPCKTICALNVNSKQWTTLGNGLGGGQVTSLVLAGNNQDSLIVSGVLSFPDSSSGNVAIFSFGNNTWTKLGKDGDLPGPVTAAEVNDGNSSSIFVTGKSTDGTQSYLSYWNGFNWTQLQSDFGSNTNISQLTMVPVIDTHKSNGLIQSDRMLLLSGALSSSSFGDVSSVLFDGQSFVPYIVSASASGSPGAVSGLIHSFTSFSFARRHFLAVGVVILISIAIAAGVVFLLVLVGILWALFSRKEDQVKTIDQDEDDDSLHQRPSSLLAHVNAATRTTILGATSPFSQYNPEKEEESTGQRSGGDTTDPFGPDASNYVRAETPSDALGASGEVGRPAHARYSFEASGEGELALTAGMQLEVLDDSDQAWWLVRDPRTNQEGVVPAAYLY